MRTPNPESTNIHSIVATAPVATKSTQQPSAHSNNNDWEVVKQHDTCRGLLGQLLQQAHLVSEVQSNNWIIRINPSFAKMASESLREKLQKNCLTVLQRDITITFQKDTIHAQKPQKTRPGQHIEIPKSHQSASAPIKSDISTKKPAKNKDAKLQQFMQDLGAEQQ